MRTERGWHQHTPRHVEGEGTGIDGREPKEDVRGGTEKQPAAGKAGGWGGGRGRGGGGGAARMDAEI